MGRPVYLSDFLEYRHGPDIIHIISKEDGSRIFLGFYSMLRDREEQLIPNYQIRLVKAWRTVPEYRVKNWKERGLIAPIFPEALPQYQLKDMEERLIYEIEI